jgi:N-acetylneuraminic acid mutarotase
VENDIYVFGGMGEKSMFKYDTIADAWSTLEPMPVACDSHSASVVDGFIYIVGASYNGHQVLRFDPASHTWSFPADTSNNVQYGASFVVRGRLYAIKGLGSASRTEIYDVTTDTWAMVAGMLESRSAFCAVAVGHVDPAEEQDLFDSLMIKAMARK